MRPTVTNNDVLQFRQFEIAKASKRIRWNFRRKHTYLIQIKFNN